VLVGQVLFSVTMWITGIQQGAMWKATDANGELKYKFIETLKANIPYWHTRTLAGIIFTVGMLFFIYNVLMTIKKGKAVQASSSVAG
jgi:cytochrome c oxidase cbb3-type subunit 1